MHAFRSYMIFRILCAKKITNVVLSCFKQATQCFETRGNVFSILRNAYASAMSNSLLQTENVNTNSPKQPE